MSERRPHPYNLGERYNQCYDAFERQGRLPYQIKQRKEVERLISIWGNQQVDAKEPDLLGQLETLVARRRTYTGYWKDVLEIVYGDVITMEIEALDHCIFGIYCSVRNNPAELAKAKKILASLSPTP